LGGYKGPANHQTPAQTDPVCDPGAKVPDAICPDTQIVDRLQVGAGHIHGSPVVWWRYPANDWRVYIWSERDTLKQVPLVQKGQTLGFGQVISAGPLTKGMPGGMLALSANDDKDGILWATHPDPAFNALSGGTCPIGDHDFPGVPGVLYAFDANTLAPLWDSTQNRQRDDLGYFAKFSPPTVAAGRVLVMSAPLDGNSTGNLRVYELLP
jgi:hypothetical protein